MPQQEVHLEVTNERRQPRVDSFIKQELLDSAGVCEEVANNIEARWTSG